MVSPKIEVSELKIPCSKLQGIFDRKECGLFYDSLAYPAASGGECARFSGSDIGISTTDCCQQSMTASENKRHLHADNNWVGSLCGEPDGVAAISWNPKQFSRQNRCPALG
jgi:hypothetical protein